MNICEFRELSFDQLERIFESEEYAVLKQRIARLTRERLELIELDADPRALGTLINCTRIALADQPAIESARKAATRAKTIMNRNAKDRAQPANQPPKQSQTQSLPQHQDQHQDQQQPAAQSPAHTAPRPNRLPQPTTNRLQSQHQPGAPTEPSPVPSGSKNHTAKRTTRPSAAQLVQHAGALPATPPDPIPPPDSEQRALKSDTQIRTATRSPRPGRGDQPAAQADRGP